MLLKKDLGMAAYYKRAQAESKWKFFLSKLNLYKEQTFYSSRAYQALSEMAEIYTQNWIENRLSWLHV